MVADRLLKTIALGLLGAGINMLPAPFETNAVFAFGFAMAVLVALLWGVRYAFIATLIVVAPLWFQELRIETALLVAQVLVIGYYCHRKTISRPLTATLIFWALIGAPVLLAKFYYADGELGILQAGTVLTDFIIGLSVSLGGHFIFIATNILWPGDKMPPIQMSFLFRYFFTGLFFFATLTVTFIYIGFFQREQRDELESFLNQRTRVVADQLHEFLRNHQTAVEVAAKTIQANPERTQEYLIDLSEAYPRFLTFLVADKSGQIIGTQPTELLDLVQRTNQLDVSYRAYFQHPKDFGTSFMSPAFEGKGFGSDPIVAISAPLFDENQDFAGIVEGSLNLSSFQIYDEREANQSVNMMVSDNRGTVLYASAVLGIAPLTSLPNSLCLGDQCSESNWQQFARSSWMSAQSTVEGFGWSVIKFFPNQVFATRVSNYIILAIAALLILTVLANIASYLLAKAFSQPLTALVRSFAAFDPAKPSYEGIQHNARRYLVEISALDDGFNELRQRLVQIFGQLNESRLGQEKLNSELHELNSSLEQRVAEKTQSLEIALKQSEQASEAKSRFLANMSHEIRTPMNGIIGSCQNLQKAALDEQSRRKLDVIHHSAVALMDILNGILDWSKIESGKMVVEHIPFKPHSVLTNCFELNQAAAFGKGLSYESSVDDSIPVWVKGDPTKVSQIVNNLLNNAIKFTDKGRVRLVARYDKQALVIQVIDSGIGISEKQRRKVFEEFSQADASTTRNFGGTGLGLAITLRLTRLMNGQLDLESELNKGTRITLTIPVETTTAAEQERVSEVHELPDGLKVLLAEDNDINAEILMEMFADNNLRMIRVPNGRVAVNALEAHEFDVVLMDCQMPVMDGFDATRAIRRMRSARARIPIIALTANAYAEDRQRCLDAGMNDHMAKPVHKQALVEKILNQLELSRRRFDLTAEGS